MLVNLRRSILVSVVFFVLLGPRLSLSRRQASAKRSSPMRRTVSLTKNGSTLVGQSWSGPKWFQGRPDADNPMSTGGTNLGPRSKVLVKDVANRSPH